MKKIKQVLKTIKNILSMVWFRIKLIYNWAANKIRSK
jgi:hypothetical protein|tara:strand:+ start:459 stop:569 length:111 start_codon:yes stop_codon:yes gene_type:complete